MDNTIVSFVRTSIKVTYALEFQLARTALSRLVAIRREGNDPRWFRIDSFSWQRFTCGYLDCQSKWATLSIAPFLRSSVPPFRRFSFPWAYSNPMLNSASKALTLICSQLLVYSFSLAGDMDHSRIGPDKNLPLNHLSSRLPTVNSNRSIGLKRLVWRTRVNLRITTLHGRNERARETVATYPRREE